jgi:recombination protein RecA
MQLDYESDPPLDGAKAIEKESSLNIAVSQLASDFDRESNLCLERFSRTRKASVVSTGSLKLDLALGVGGLPKVIMCSYHFYLFTLLYYYYYFIHGILT